MPELKARAPRKKHIRRQPEEAKSKILDACERILRNEGPDELKLDRIAEESGYTSPVAVHHFGSMANVKRALILRMTQGMLDEFNVMMVQAVDNKTPMIDGMRELFKFYRDPTYLKLVTWLVSTNQTAALSPLLEPFYKHMADTKKVWESVGNQKAATPEGLASFFGFMTFAAIGMSVGRHLLPKDVVDAIPRDEMEKWTASVLVEMTGSTLG